MGIISLVTSVVTDIVEASINNWMFVDRPYMLHSYIITLSHNTQPHKQINKQTNKHKHKQTNKHANKSETSKNKFGPLSQQSKNTR